jgi:hypothetical protein
MVQGFESLVDIKRPARLIAQNRMSAESSAAEIVMMEATGTASVNDR